MKKSFKSIGKSFLFFICWSITVGFPLMICEKPKCLKGNKALLRLYWELGPLLMTIIITIIFTKIVERKNSIKVNIFNNVTSNTIMGIVIGILWIGLVILITISMGVLHIEKKLVVSNVFLWILAIFFNTIMQELMCRGYMFSLLRRDYNLTSAIIITTAIFTFMHGGAFQAGFLAVINIVSTSILLSLILVSSKSLWAPILAHFTWNTVGRFLGIVSLAEDYPIMFKTKISGNTLISGGKVGIEGSIIVLIINCIFIVALINYIKFQNK